MPSVLNSVSMLMTQLFTPLLIVSLISSIRSDWQTHNNLNLSRDSNRKKKAERKTLNDPNESRVTQEERKQNNIEVKNFPENLE